MTTQTKDAKPHPSVLLIPGLGGIHISLPFPRVISFPIPGSILHAVHKITKKAELIWPRLRNGSTLTENYLLGHFDNEKYEFKTYQTVCIHHSHVLFINYPILVLLPSTTTSSSSCLPRRMILLHQMIITDYMPVMYLFLMCHFLDRLFSV